MSERMSPAEERTTELLRAGMRSDGDTSADLVDMLMVGYDLTVTNGPIAEVLEDTALTGSVATRGAHDTEPRFLTCEAAGVHFEFEIDGSTIIGTIDPPQAGRVVLQQPGPVAESALGRSGSFEVALTSEASFRLVFQPEEGVSVATTWILP